MSDALRPADAAVLERLMRTRRSVRRFASDPVPRAAVEAVVEAGRLAPYAGLAQRGTTDFRRFFAVARGNRMQEILRARVRAVVGAKAAALEADASARGPDPRAAGMIAAMKGIAEKGLPPWEAPWLLVVAERKGFPLREGQAVAHCLQNMWLEATALGLGMQVVSAVEDLSADADACGALGIRPGEFLLGACLLGLPAGPLRDEARAEPAPSLLWYDGEESPKEGSAMRLGIQVMGLFRELRPDPWGTLATLRDAGYEDIEVISDWGFRPETREKYRALSGGLDPGWSRDEIRERLPRLRALGLDLPGMFVSDEALGDEADALAAFCAELRIRYVVFAAQDLGGSPAAAEAFAAVVRAAGKALRPVGVELLLHTHEWDFRPMADAPGESAAERLLALCADVGLALELDTGWATYAGVDVPAFIHAHGPSIAVLHIKEIARGYASLPRDRIFRPAGEGACDHEGIFAAARAACRPDVRVVVDQDPSERDSLADNLASARYLKRFLE